MAKKKSKGKCKTGSPKANVLATVNPGLATVNPGLATVNQPPKVCRLCENKEGPFHNIFDAETVTAKKIKELLPFEIAENDDLPQKICFRCSAKVEELFEFIQKCIKTQENLNTALGKKKPEVCKKSQRSLWEEKLNKSNISMDFICDAIIKRAMEGAKVISLPLELKEKVKETVAEDSVEFIQTISDDDEIPVCANDVDSKTKKLKRVLPKCDQSKKSTQKMQNSDNVLSNSNSNASLDKRIPTVKNISTESHGSSKNVSDVNMKKNNLNDIGAGKKAAEKFEPDGSLFNIMNHVSEIKVSGVGVLYQCRLCNRNFLEKGIVKSHGCAKNAVPQQDFTKTVTPPQPPKKPVVKYINTKTDDNLKKSAQDVIAKSPLREESSKLGLQAPSGLAIAQKPKIGPASKVRRFQNNVQSPPITKEPHVTAQTQPEIGNGPALPNLKSLYKFVPGPNNTFTLVQDQMSSNITKITKNSKKRSVTDSDETTSKSLVKKGNITVKPPESITNVEDQPSSKSALTQPYPVGLFKTLSNSTPPSTNVPTFNAFSASDIKKQSYKVVPTNNPGKLLISSVEQPVIKNTTTQMNKNRTDKLTKKSQSGQSFPAALEETSVPKDPAYFTFINVDPLQQPSFVLPTDSVHDSQTSNVPAAQNLPQSDTKYSCNMCDKTYSREKALLTHIQSHYSKMDEEDQLRSERGSRKRSRKL